LTHKNEKSKLALIVEGAMKTISRFVIILLLVFTTAGCGSIAAPDSTPIITSSPVPMDTKITYLGNSGFLITVGDKKILIDALYKAFQYGYQIPSTEMESMMSATPPFDDVDLVLATHKHADHFSVQTVREYLEKNPEAKFASVAQVTSMLSEFGDRVITMDAKNGAPVEANIDGIEVEAIYLSHGVPSGGAVETINNAYVVTINGITIFQTGDVDPGLFETENLQGYQLAEKNIDIALIPHFILSDPAYLNDVKELIKSKYIIAIHYEYGDSPVNRVKIKEYYPDAVLFNKEMQSWEMPE
jgi:L-ascorbate metabolism protein UlaG (beta-lactamase superfamily)